MHEGIAYESLFERTDMFEQLTSELDSTHSLQSGCNTCGIPCENNWYYLDSVLENHLSLETLETEFATIGPIPVSNYYYNNNPEVKERNNIPCFCSPCD